MKSGFSQLAPGSGVNALFSVRKSANCLIRLSSAESSLSWWPHDLDADRRVESRVGRHHPTGRVLDQRRERGDVRVDTSSGL